MTFVKPRRGRPPGSGIDDSQRLKAVMTYLTEHPGTRPTTAIRALGEADPSVIRRLRNKIQAEIQGRARRPLAADARLGLIAAAPAAPGAANGSQPAPAIRLVADRALPSASDLIQGITQYDLLQSYQAMLGMSVSGAQSLIDSHMQLTERLLKDQLFSTWLAQHVVMTDVMIAAGVPSRNRSPLKQA